MNGMEGELDTRSPATEMLRVVFQAQERRARAYAAFERSFKVFLDSGDELVYSSACKAATETFAEASVRIRECGKQLRDMRGEVPAALQAAEYIDALQKAERLKLDLTVKLHLLGADFIVRKQQPEDPVFQNEYRSLKHKTAEVIDEINENIQELRSILLDCCE